MIIQEVFVAVVVGVFSVISVHSSFCKLYKTEVERTLEESGKKGDGRSEREGQIRGHNNTEGEREN